MMMYIIRISNWNKPVYRVIDTNTDSIIDGDKDYIIDIARKCKLGIKNAEIKGRKLVIDEWQDCIQYNGYDKYIDRNYVLVGKINNDKYRLVYSSSGKPICMSKYSLRMKAINNEIANYHIKNTNGEIEYFEKDVLDIRPDSELVDIKYNKFIAKSALLGTDMSFNYTIEGKNVKLLKYTGKSKRVIVPSFVTSIGTEAFKDTEIEEIKLSEGLRFIGINAFEQTELKEIVLPNTLEYMFNSTKNRYEGPGVSNKKHLGLEGIKCLNASTIIV